MHCYLITQIEHSHGLSYINKTNTYIECAICINVYMYICTSQDEENNVREKYEFNSIVFHLS